MNSIKYDTEIKLTREYSRTIRSFQDNLILHYELEYNIKAQRCRGNINIKIRIII